MEECILGRGEVRGVWEEWREEKLQLGYNVRKRNKKL